MEKFLGVDDIGSVRVDDRNLTSRLTVSDESVDVLADAQPTAAADIGDRAIEVKLAQSVATSCTINPEDIRARTKKQLKQKHNRDAYRKSLVVKGETSAVTRCRRDNRDVVKQYAGWEEF